MVVHEFFVKHLPKHLQDKAAAVHSFGWQRKKPIMGEIMCEACVNPNSKLVIDKILSVAQAFKDSRPVAAPKKPQPKAKSKPGPKPQPKAKVTLKEEDKDSKPRPKAQPKAKDAELKGKHAQSIEDGTGVVLAAMINARDITEEQPTL